MERSKYVAIKEDLEKTKIMLTKIGVTKPYTKEPSKSKWKFYKHAKVTGFAALLREVHMVCRDGVMAVPLTKNHTFNCKFYKENSRKT